jgi:ATP-binding cassette subfamily B protein
MEKQRFFAPEVIQTSEMDCGPATLKCLLEGFGIMASYGRLREACQTDVDGTSIDTMEDLAVQLGLDAQQTMLPEDHLLLPEADVLPAIVVTTNPGGLTHFVVVWRIHGPFIQVMDPSTGRRWLTRERFLRSVYHHAMPVPAGVWREWAGGAGFIEPLQWRLEKLSLEQEKVEDLLTKALEDPGWYGFAALDATTRMITSLVSAGGMQSGTEATNILERYFLKVLEAKGSGEVVIPAAYWRVQAMPAEYVRPGEDELIVLQGVVLVRVLGRLQKADDLPGDEAEMPLSPELVAALEEEQLHPMREIWRYLAQDGRLLLVTVIIALGFMAAAGIVEMAQLRGLLDLGNTLGPEQLNSVLLLFFIFAIFLLALQMPLESTTFRAGRRLETRLRTAFLRKIPRLNDRYFQSRLISDMTQRAHDLRSLSSFPNLGTSFVRTVFQFFLTVAAVILLDPKSLFIALLAMISSIALTVVSNTYLVELDLRLRTHVGALSRFYLDALLGLIPIRTHGAERIVRREHEAMLVEWARTGYQMTGATVAVTGIQAFVSTLFSVWLLFNYVSSGGTPAGVLLIFFWALSLPGLGQSLANFVQQYRIQRNRVLRLLEPLGAPEDTFVAANTSAEDSAVAQDSIDPSDPKEAVQSETPGVKGIGIGFEGVSVQAGGNTILSDINLSIAPGTHLAIVGPSGAGKSSLVGLLLGWHRPAEGRLLIDGQPLSAEQLQRLRQETAWVDPTIQLWNRSFLDNLRYGATEANGLAMDGILEQADLFDVLERMPSGFQTSLGEGGGSISGGEGQRVRLGRAMQRPQARLVILDEPFRGLDRAKRRSLLSKARQLWSEATLIYISHDVSQTQAFDRVLVIDGGRIIEDAEPEILLNDADSRYQDFMAADKVVQEQLWTGAEWRHLSIAGGRLTEFEAAQGVGE